MNFHLFAVKPCTQQEKVNAPFVLESVMLADEYTESVGQNPIERFFVPQKLLKTCTAATFEH